MVGQLVYRAANHYVLAVVCYAQGHCTMLLRSWSYHYALPQKNKYCLFFYPVHLCGYQIRQQPVVRVPFCVWDVGCATAYRRSHFNQLTNRSVWFNSRSYASLPGETTSVFSHFKSPCRSEKPKASSRVMNLKKMHTKISGKSMIQNSFCALYDQHRVPSMWSAAPASSVLGGMYDVEQRVNLKRHIKKGKAIGNTLKISH